MPCASCGNPTNGAPPRPARPATNTTGIIIGVAAAGFAIVAFVGILAAIALPNMLTAMERAKQKRTIADMRLVARAIDRYLSDHPQLPPGPYVAQLEGALQPTYVQTLPQVDGWGIALHYLPLEGGGYAIGSAGANGTFERESLDQYEDAATKHFDCDIVFAGGEFVQYPDDVALGGTR